MTRSVALREGTTLIELMMVLVVLGIVGVLVAVGGGGVQRSTLSSPSLVQATRDARTDAIRLGRPQTRHARSDGGLSITVTVYPTGLIRVDSAAAPAHWLETVQDAHE